MSSKPTVPRIRKGSTSQANSSPEPIGAAPFVLPYVDHRADRDAADRALAADSRASLPRDKVPAAIWSALSQVPEEMRAMVQFRKLSRLISHVDMVTAYQLISKRSTPSEQQWHALVAAVLQATSAAINIQVAKARFAEAVEAMTRIAKHCDELEAAIRDFWEAATTKQDWWRIAMLTCPIGALTYPGARENDNPSLSINQLPFTNPPLRALIQRLAAEAKLYEPNAVDGVMNAAIRGDRTEESAFVRAFDASIEGFAPESRITVGPKPLAIVALVMLRESWKSQRNDWDSWAGNFKVIRHRERTG